MMNRPFRVLVALVPAILVLSQTPIAAQDPMTVEDVLALNSVGQVSISPDGRWIAYVVTERDFEEDRNETDIWMAAADGGDPVRLTYRAGSETSPRWHPSGQWLAFRSDRSGSDHVYGINPNGGEAWAVTEGDVSVQGFRFSPNGQRLAFSASAEPTDADRELEELRGRPIVWDSSYTDQWSHIWVAELADRRAGESVRWTPDTLHTTASFVWSPDSRRIAFAARPSPILRTYPQGAVYVVDSSESSLRRVTHLPGSETPVAWRDDLGIVFSGSGHQLGTFNNQLWRIDPDGGDPASLTADFDENAGFVAVTSDRLLIESTIRTGRGLYEIRLRDGRASGRARSLSDEAKYFAGFDATPDGETVAFLAEDARAPADVHVSSTSSFAPRRVTDHNPKVREFALGEQRVIRWQSRADGEEIEGVLTLPVGYTEGSSVPLVLVIHGGPSGVSSNRFSAARGAYPIQVYAGLGFAVLQPNYRGSTGYGQRFRALNRGDISGRDWIDIDSGVDELVRSGLADPGRLGVSGWSFGGHHTYWGITQTQRYAAASAGAGANDLISMYSQTDIPEFYHTYLGPKPWEDFELYEQRSAYRYVERVTTPLLIQVGERDERVPAEQSIQFYEAVKAIGKAPTKLVVYPEQPHGVRAPRLVRDLMTRNVEWFTRWMGAVITP